MTEMAVAQTDGVGTVLDELLVEQLREVPGRDGGTLLDEMVPTFLATFGERVDAVRAAVRNGDIEGAGRLAHSLAGSLGTFGARDLATGYARFERTARDGHDRSVLLAELDALDAGTRSVDDALRRLLA